MTNVFSLRTWLLLALCFSTAPLVAVESEITRLMRDSKTCAVAEAFGKGLPPQLNTPCYAGPINCGQTVTGRVSVDSCEANSYYAVGYSFNATQGQRVSIAGRSPAFNARVIIFDGRTGNDTIYADTQAGFTGGTATATFTAPHTGEYLVMITPNQRAIFGDYSLVMTCTTAPPPPPPPPPPSSGSCNATSSTEACIGDRFKVSVRYSDTTALPHKQMQANKYSANSVLFWFNDNNNIEVMVKTVNACSFNGHHWIYAGGTTDVDFQLTVVDTKTGVTKTYNQTGRKPFQTITDGTAFATCP